MGPEVIQVKAMAVIWRGHALLVSEADDGGAGPYHRPLGGSIEFGETGDTAVVREIQEELGVALTDVRLLGVLENHFAFNSEPRHEIDFIFEGRITDKTVLRADRFVGRECDGSDLDCLWIDPMRESHIPLYPDGLRALLNRSADSTG